MTRRPYLDERDPAEPREWTPTSSAGIRRLALAQTAAAVKAARDKKPAEIRNATEETAPMSETAEPFVCITPARDEVCECGGYEEWEYETCEACFLPAPSDYRSQATR